MNEVVQKAIAADPEPIPLCVDLDGTLVNADTLVEALFGLLLRDPLQLIPLPFHLSRGRSAFKAEVARRLSPDPASLPYNESLLERLKAAKAEGRRLVLVTAADRLVAESVAAHLDLFDEVIASDGATNLKGAAKAEALCRRFGEKGFDYAGDAEVDLAVWEHARQAILVNAGDRLARRAAARCPEIVRIDDRRSRPRAVVRALRPHQWVKNILLFVPLIAAGALRDGAGWVNTVLATVAFCLTASGVYVSNDLFDLASDRRHPRKRLRPFAHGDLSILAGLALAAALLTAGLVLGAAFGVGWIIVLYTLLSSAYSARLKLFPLVDVFILASLYTIRVVAGGVAGGHPVSLWLLGFSCFLFLSLAMVKRVAELQPLPAQGGQKLARRGYKGGDVEILCIMGVASTFASALILVLYVQSVTASALYSNPLMLWGIVPLLLFWQCRLWLSTARGYMHDDPIVYAAGDWVSWLVGLLLLVSLLVAKVTPPLAGSGILLPTGH